MIFRTSWVYSAQGKNFLRTILKLARERETLRVVADQVGAPTWSRDLAKMAAATIQECEAASEVRSLPAVMADMGGIYHAAGAGETTWFGFATQALQLQREMLPSVRFAEIEAITTAEYPTPARRPLNSRMNCDKLQTRFGWKMMDWKESLRRVSVEI
jgi:dTDP-4-dehydrorhamnose reductase